MTNIVAGPLVMGVHVSVWAFWTFLSTTTFTLGHTGWHIPLIPHAPEAHDFHHSQGWAIFGTFPGLLDARRGTSFGHGHQGRFIFGFLCSSRRGERASRGR